MMGMKILIVHGIIMAIYFVIRRFLFPINAGAMGLYLVLLPNCAATFISLSPWLVLAMTVLGVSILIIDIKRITDQRACHSAPEC